MIPESASPRAWLVGGLLIFFVAVAAFQPALYNRLTHDDMAQTTHWEIPSDFSGWIETVAQPWWPLRLHKHDWRPLARLTFLAQAAFLPPFHDESDADDIWPFYVFNLAAHAGVCLLLFALAARWGFGLIPALICALIFAAHPLHAEAVHQIVGRTELLAAFWMLAGLLLWTRWGPLSAHALWQQPLIFILALGSKEHAALYPAYLILASLAGPVGGLAADRGWRRWSDSRIFARAILFFCILAAIGAAYLLAKDRITNGLVLLPRAVAFTENPLFNLPFADRLPAGLGGAAYFLARILCPADLSPDYSAYSLPYAAGWRWPYAAIGAALLGLAVLYAVQNALRGGRGWALVAGGALGWLLTSNIFFPIGEGIAPRLWYWPSAAVCLGLGWGLARAIDRLPAAARRLPRLVVPLAATIVLLAIAWRDAAAWRSEEAYSRATLRIFPDSWRAHVNLATSAYLAKDFETGYAEAKRAAQLQNNVYSWGWVGMNAMFLPGHLDEAEFAFKKALALDPTRPETYKNMANLLKMAGRPEEAAAILEKMPQPIDASAADSKTSFALPQMN